MKKELFLFLVILMILPAVSAVGLKVEKQSTSQDVIIEELDRPAVFILNITNNGASGDFVIDNTPEFFTIDPVYLTLEYGETKQVELKVYAREDYSYTKPFYSLNYEIKEGDASQSGDLTVKVVELKNVFEIYADKIDPESEQTTLHIKNKENADFENVNAEFTSAFFTDKESFSLAPKGEKTFTIQLDKDKFKGITAGYYTITSKLDVDGTETSVDGKIEFAEKNLVIDEKNEYGFFIVTNVVSKTNEGNVIVDSDTEIKKNIISRLFTSFNTEPDSVERDGFTVTYGWYREVKPGEKLEIRTTTNWLFPVIIIVLIIVAVVFAKKYSRTNLLLRKRVNFVRTPSGEFALKVSIVANAKEHLERISIIDRLPPLVKLHDRFGSEHPTRIDEKNRRIEWDVGNLERGEVRIFSYIIYSKVGLLGKFALPSARAVYEKDGKIEETTSNRAFFVAEQKRGEVEGY